MIFRIFFISIIFSIAMTDIPIKNRLLVPIYLRVGASIGYNDNIFQCNNK